MSEIKKVEDKIEYYPLTHPQKGIWYTEKMYPGTSIGNIEGTVRFKDRVNFELLEKAINFAIENNDGLRLRIIEEDGEPKQFISEYKDVKLDLLDFSNSEDPLQELFKWDEKQARTPFKLSISDLFYFALIKVSDNDSGFYIKMHHLISDAWTMTLVTGQIIEYYSSLKDGYEVSLEEKPSYIDYILSEQEYKKSARFQKDKEYWIKKFEGWKEVTTLKTHNPNDFVTKARRKTLLAPKKLTTKIYEYCSDKGVSPFILFFAALSMYLNRIKGYEDITLGTTFLNRANKREKETSGMFANIAVPARVSIKDDMSFNNLAEAISKEMMTLLRHQKYPYDLLINAVKEEYQVSGNLFDIFLTYQNSKLNKEKHKEEYITRWHFRGHQVESLIIHINDREDDGHLIINYDYLTHLFHATEIEFIHQHIINLLWHALDNPEKLISKLNMLSEKERHKVLYEFNDLETNQTKDKIIDKLFGEQSKGTVDNTKLYILDKNNNLLPIGTPGELCVGGDLLLGHLGISQDKILSNPFIPGERIYRTGELARWYPRGEIELFGKIDLQKTKDLKEQTHIKIAATFTSEPIGDYIEWWGSKFGHDLKIEFAAYNQVFQELLDPNSMLSKNKNGINVVLIRFEDFIRNDKGTEETKILKLEQVFEEVKQAISKFNSSAPLVVAVFPVSTHLNLSRSISEKISHLNSGLKAMLSEYKNIYAVDFNDLQELYDIEEVFDSLKDKEGHLPFSEEYYAAIGTEIARKICVIKKQQFKVIVVDCDETLWRGICGEQGALGVKVEGGYKELQQFLIQKYNEGMILAVCSKNNQEDVLEVFDKNPGMVLERKHITSWKVSWQEKGKAIKEIADELNLGLDSFIFIDDSSIECSKMVENCPEVLTLQLPTEEEYIPLFLKHVWAFDRVKVTKEDSLRSRMYEAEQKRKEAKGAGIPLDDFIKNLDLKVSMREIKDSEIDRVTQLTQRTNQFNLSTIRRTEQEVAELMKDDKTNCFVVEASDKFGDYGIIGLVILKEEKEKLFVDTFLLSCRVLGRKVEDAVLAGIRICSEKQGKHTVDAIFIATEKNTPMLDFIERTKWIKSKEAKNQTLYSISVNDLPKEIEHISFYYNEMYEKDYEEVKPPSVQEVYEIDHIAIAVKDIKKTEDYYKQLGYNIVNSVYDPLQNSVLSIMDNNKYSSIELVAPVNENSPTYNRVELFGETPYHLCYRVSSIREFLEKISHIEFELISDEKPAVLFNNRKVAFIIIKKVGIIELVETGAEAESRNKNSKFKDNTVKLVVGDMEKALIFYKELGYENIKTSRDVNSNLLIAILVGYFGEKIELIVPLEKNTTEYEFLRQNGPGVYQIVFEDSNLDELKTYSSQSSFEFEVYEENGKLIDKLRKYNVFSKTGKGKITSSSDYNLCNTEILDKTIHKEHLLPIENFTGKRLLKLPIFEESSNDISEYEAPRSDMEEKLAEILCNVLKVKKVGISDDFFNLGGDSLSAVSAIARIHKEFRVELTLKDLFEASTIKKLVERIKCSNKSEFEDIKPFEKKEYYELSSAQKRMYILSQMEKESTGYNECQKILIEGNLEIRRLESAVRQLISRHESLRTGFEVLNGKPVQKIYDQVDFDIEYLKVSETEIDGITKEFIKPFELSKPPLLRMKLLEIEKEEHILLLDIHHIIIDGVSFGILAGELFSLYDAEQLNPLKIQYKDFAHWQNLLVKSEKIAKQEEYWIEQFKGEIHILDIPTDYTRPVVQSFKGSKKYFTLEQDTLKKLKKVCDNTDTTLFMVLFAAFNILLHRYTGQEDIILGTPVSGRNHADLNGIIGMFVNTLPIRTYPRGESKFSEYLNEVKETVLKGLENQDYQYDHLVDILDFARDMSRNPLFDVMFALQNFDIPEMVTKDLKFSQYKMDNNNSRFDISLSAIEKDGELGFEMVYCTELFKEDTIRRLVGHFLNILKDVSNEPQKLIADIEILSEEEKYKILNKFNDTKVDYPKDKTIHELFEEQVERTPDSIAVFFEGNQLTYRELNSKANCLARVLREKSIKSESIVGLMVERSLEMVIGIFAILKAGGAYLPIDPAHPRERVQYMLEDAKVTVLLTQKSLIDIVQFDGEIIDLENNDIYALDNSNLEKVSRPKDLAYIIYTSGTTGNPKGVMVEQKGAVNLYNWFSNKYDLNKNKRVINLTNFTFDVSIEEIIITLLSGATVYIPEKETILNKIEILKYLNKHKINIAQFVPALLRELLVDSEKVDSLNIVICGGESLDNQLKKSILSKGYSLYNHYGPTEVTVDAITTKCSEDKVMIGKPIDNCECYILDKYLNLLPIGVAGELFIAGENITRGYLNNFKQTKERFIDNPFKQHQKMYKTGDIVRWSATGEIEYLGRTDDQVKIRGNRVELDEIKLKLLEHEGIKDVAIAARKDKKGNSQLVAYIVPKYTLKVINGEDIYKLYNCEQRPYLQEKIEQLHTKAWPSFFMGDKVHRKYWPKIYKTFSRYQIGLLDKNENLLSVGNSITIYWDGKKESLPQGWDDALLRGFENHDQNQEPNTLCVLAGVVNPDYKGKGLSYKIIEAMKLVASTQNLKYLIIPVRPTLKENHPYMSLEKYINLRREDGKLYDNWLRVHEHLGGKILDVSLKSQEITGQVKHWEIWGGQKFNESGNYVIKGAMHPINIDIEKDKGIYYDQAVWIQHSIDKVPNDITLTVPEIREFLSKNLPTYMIPNNYVFIDEFPLSVNGKLDIKALAKFDGKVYGESHKIPPANDLEKILAKIWCQLLDINGISRNQSFFEVGGNSIESIRLISEIYNYFDVEVSFIEIYNSPTIEGLSKLISEKLFKDNKNDIDIGTTHMLLNEKKEKNIFAFPPIGGFGLAYRDMAKCIDGFSVYAFNYIEDEDKIDKYFNVIKSIQKEGPYILLGFSAGADIVIDLCRKVKEEVIIILMDGFFGGVSQIGIEEEIRLIINYSTGYMNLDKDNKFINKILEQKIRSYINYLANKSEFESKIDKDIYFLQSDEMDDSRVDNLKDLTTGSIIKFKAYGKHLDLLTNGYVEKNTEIINKILKEIYKIGG